MKGSPSYRSVPRYFLSRAVAPLARLDLVGEALLCVFQGDSLEFEHGEIACPGRSSRSIGDLQTAEPLGRCRPEARRSRRRSGPCGTREPRRCIRVDRSAVLAAEVVTGPGVEGNAAYRGRPE